VISKKFEVFEIVRNACRAFFSAFFEMLEIVRNNFF